MTLLQIAEHVSREARRALWLARVTAAAIERDIEESKWRRELLQP
jgi:hypothetical protein